MCALRTGSTPPSGVWIPLRRSPSFETLNRSHYTLSGVCFLRLMPTSILDRTAAYRSGNLAAECP